MYLNGLFLVLWCDSFALVVLTDEPRLNQGRGLVDRKLVKAPPLPVISFLTVPRRLFCFVSLVILDVARCYLCLFSVYINIKIGKIVVKC